MSPLTSWRCLIIEDHEFEERKTPQVREKERLRESKNSRERERKTKYERERNSGKEAEDRGLPKGTPENVE